MALLGIALQEVRVVELEEPSGWVVVPLTTEGTNEPLRAFYVQLAVLANHQNGRDTHIRQVRGVGCTPGAHERQHAGMSYSRSVAVLQRVRYACLVSEGPSGP